jgi:hypothetical protein
MAVQDVSCAAIDCAAKKADPAPLIVKSLVHALFAGCTTSQNTTITAASIAAARARTHRRGDDLDVGGGQHLSTRPDPPSPTT